ncbi:hypothetical protein BDP55DRAFT_271688 [Colletotrichum godetiae]|uniref:Uncharacterized protein n=1 Tax=Colletotrichum godetiae TaxID=1209918 RepID=A0AAJ0F1G9_9PEZI|nr:uncharacterized protein BDP55DRAFT_271688 [Colletotrichum godetiae]KAK1691676.1 hypothetical protein BDP55DRAFT_271688 [Colletotrichum godetiae]
MSVNRDSFRRSRSLSRSDAEAPRPIPIHQIRERLPPPTFPQSFFRVFKLWADVLFAFLRGINETETPTLILHCFFRHIDMADEAGGILHITSSLKISTLVSHQCSPSARISAESSTSAEWCHLFFRLSGIVVRALKVGA